MRQSVKWVMFLGPWLMFGCTGNSAALLPTDTALKSSDSSTSSTSSDSGDPLTGDTSDECKNDGEIVCNYECIIPNVDDHCGGCNVRCGSNTTCQEVDGVYDCHCPKDTLTCNNKCVDPFTDKDYCGASGDCTGSDVGEACGQGEECVNGICQCDATHTECGGACVNTLTDIYYCSSKVGECGVPCMTGGVCNIGVCECPAATPNECAVGCVDFLTDSANCGGCADVDGKVCDTQNGYACIAGECQCAVGTELCDGVCTNTATDPDNCGGCYNSGTGPGIQCGYVDAPTNTIRQGCFGTVCVDSPCDSAVMGDVCEGLTVRDKSKCYTSDDHFTVEGIKCDNNDDPNNPNKENIPKDTAVCYEILHVPTFEEFRCWWSGRNLTVNGTVMACNNNGDNYLSLPTSVSGSYCVYFPPSVKDGAQSDGFSIGVR